MIVDFLPRGTILGPLEMDRVLDWCDGPRTFVVRNTTRGRYLAFWADEVGEQTHWLYAGASEGRLGNVECGLIDLRDVFTSPEFGVVFLVKLNPDNSAAVELLSPAQLYERHLPLVGDRLRNEWKDESVAQPEGAVPLTHRLIVSKVRSRLRNRFDSLSRAASMWSHLVKSSLSAPPLLVDSGLGSLRADLFTENGNGLIQLIEKTRGLLVQPTAELIGLLSDNERASLKDLLDAICEDGVQVRVSIVENDEFPSLLLSPEAIEGLRKALSNDIRTRLDSYDIPQADDLSKVFSVIEFMCEGEQNLAARLGVDKRQVNYYKHAARVLGLLGEGNEVTSQGWHLAELDDRSQLYFAQALFEGSRVGSAWLRTQGVAEATQLETSSALTFLRQSCRGSSLSPETMTRRAKTLVSWVLTFMGER